MKKTFILYSIFISIAFSQTEKRNMLIGGGVSFNYSNNNYTYISFPEPSYSVDNLNFNISPSFGKFVANNFLVGGMLNLNVLFEFYSNSSFNGSYISIGSGPLLRYYFGKNPKTKFFIHGNVVPSAFFNTNSNSPTNTSFRIQGGVGPGVAFIINQSYSIDLLLNIGGSGLFSTNNRVSSFQTSFGVGINGLLSGKKKE